MASYKNVQKSRQKKESHFSYTSERMTSLTSPPPGYNRTRDRDCDTRHDARSVLSVRPDQEPVLRQVPGETLDQDNVSRVSSLSSDISIPPEALSKLQEIIDAQKAFLKYQEIREILSTHESSNKGARAKTRKISRVPSAESDLSKSISLQLQSDSDKENSKSSKPSSSHGSRYVA